MNKHEIAMAFYNECVRFCKANKKKIVHQGAFAEVASNAANMIVASTIEPKVITSCNGCPFCALSITGHRIYATCNLQENSGRYWNPKADYSELFKKCPLKGKTLSFTV